MAYIKVRDGSTTPGSIYPAEYEGLVADTLPDPTSFPPGTLLKCLDGVTTNAANITPGDVGAFEYHSLGSLWYALGSVKANSKNKASIGVVVDSLIGSNLIAPTSVSAGSQTVVKGNTVELKTRDTVGSDLGYLLLTINGTDDATDSARFSSPDETVSHLRIGEDYEIPYNADISRVSIVAIGAENNLNSGVILAGEGVVGLATALSTFTFPTGVRNLRVVSSKRSSSNLAGETNRVFTTISVLGSA